MKFRRNNLVPLLAFTLLISLAACRPLAATPEETVAPIITPTSNLLMPMPTSTLPAPMATLPVATPSSPAPTVDQPSPTATQVAVPLTCGSLVEPGCNVQQAETLAGFKVFVPNDLPEGLSFLGAIATPGDSSTQAYSCGEECYLTIHQQILEQTQDWLDSRNHRGEFIPVGSHIGFYCSNNFAIGNGLPTQPGNAASANQVLQWVDYIDHIQFGLRISVYGSTPENSNLDREGLTKLAHDTRGVPIPSGLIAFESIRDGNAEIYARNYFDQEPTNLTTHPAADHSFAWSPDGERIAFLSDRSGALEVFAMQPDGSNVLQLTQGSGVPWKGTPAWSPDGTRLALTGAAYTSSEDGSLIYLVNVDGSGFSLLSDEPVYTDWPLQWSPDGLWIAFSENFIERSANGDYSFAGDSGLKSISLDGSKKLKLSGQDNIIVGGFDWSPDGQTLAYVWMRDPLGDVNLMLANADGAGAYIAATEEGYSGQSMGDLAWSPNGILIAYMIIGETGGSPPDYGMVYLYDPDKEIVGLVLSIPYTVRSRMSWSPEELQILFAADAPRDQTHGVYAALLEQDATRRPYPIWIIEGTYALEESWIDARENTNPQWQPRP